MNFMDGYRPKVEAELRLLVQKGSTPLLDLNTMNSYHMGFSDRDGKPSSISKGKYLRPLFCIAMCAGLGGDPEQAIPAAAALELAHRTTLIFDDIQDQGQERNNQPTMWAVWGSDQAINAGLALSCYARLALHRLTLRNVPSDKVLGVSSVLENAVIDICQGQFMDISFVEAPTVRVKEYLQMVRGKTGALFAASCSIGAMLASVTYRLKGYPASAHEGERPVADMARDFGMNMGIAFQIHDDYLGIWGDEAMVGKTANDLIEKKRSLPMVLALQEYPEPVSAFLARETITPEEAGLIKNSMEIHGIPERVREIEYQYANAALEKLEALELETPWHDELEGVLRFVIKRSV